MDCRCPVVLTVVARAQNFSSPHFLTGLLMTPNALCQSILLQLGLFAIKLPVPIALTEYVSSVAYNLWSSD